MKDFSELSFPADRRYAKDHEWLTNAAPRRVGVSDFAQDALGDLTYVELPEVGKDFKAGEEFGSLESIKSVSSVYMPVAGKVTAVNTALADDPGLVNTDPYGNGWLIEIDVADAAQADSLMTAEVYAAQVKENG